MRDALIEAICARDMSVGAVICDQPCNKMLVNRYQNKNKIMTLGSQEPFIFRRSYGGCIGVLVVMVLTFMYIVLCQVDQKVSLRHLYGWPGSTMVSKATMVILP